MKFEQRTKYANTFFANPNMAHYVYKEMILSMGNFNEKNTSRVPCGS